MWISVVLFSKVFNFSFNLGKEALIIYFQNCHRYILIVVAGKNREWKKKMEYWILFWSEL